MIRGALIALLTLEDDLDTPDPCNPLHRYVTRFRTYWASANDGADVSHGCAGCGGYRIHGKPEGRACDRHLPPLSSQSRISLFLLAVARSTPRRAHSASFASHPKSIHRTPLSGL
jgi:hypothetical protein